METSEGFASLVPELSHTSRSTLAPAPDPSTATETVAISTDSRAESQEHSFDAASSREWAGNVKLLLTCFGVSGLYTLCTYFLPFLRNIPVFGGAAAHAWLWTLNPSPAYVGQGIIMGEEVTLHSKYPGHLFVDVLPIGCF